MADELTPLGESSSGILPGSWDWNGLVTWVIRARRGVLGTPVVSTYPHYETKQAALDALAQFGPDDGYVDWI